MEDTSKEVVEETSTPVEPDTTVEEPSTPEEEPQVEETETPRVYAGKYKSPEDLEKAYQEAQKLISQQGQKLKEVEQPSYSPDEKEVQETLKNLGFMTKEEFEQNKSIESQKAKDNAEIAQLGLNEQQEAVVRAYAANPNNLSKSMTDCWNEVSNALGGSVVKRKTTIKPKSGSQDGFKELSPREVARLPQEEADKYWREYAASKAE